MRGAARPEGSTAALTARSSGATAAAPSGFGLRQREIPVSPSNDPRSTPECIDRFRGRYAFLSNFHRAPLKWSGKEYRTAEVAFRGAKTRDERERECTRNVPSLSIRVVPVADARTDRFD